VIFGSPIPLQSRPPTAALLSCRGHRSVDNLRHQRAVCRRALPATPLFCHAGRIMRGTLPQHRSPSGRRRPRESSDTRQPFPIATRPRPHRHPALRGVVRHNRIGRLASQVQPVDRGVRPPACVWNPAARQGAVRGGLAGVSGAMVRHRGLSQTDHPHPGKLPGR